MRASLLAKVASAAPWCHRPPSVTCQSLVHAAPQGNPVLAKVCVCAHKQRTHVYPPDCHGAQPDARQRGDALAVLALVFRFDLGKAFKTSQATGRTHT